jgi:hypothetical protein
MADERTAPIDVVASDDAPQVLAAGNADVAFAVFSMSSRAADGDDDGYLEWHMLDHLPEQYRIDGLRLGQRWFSTDACRAARAASEAPYDAVDHVVGYLFGGDVDPAVDIFFDLGASLYRAGRMPVALPRVQVGGWEAVARAAAPRALAGADVVPWRPQRGVYLIVESITDEGGADDPALDQLIEAPGVAGVWRYRDGHDRHRRLDDCTGWELAVCYLDDDPVKVAGWLGDRLAARWADPAITPLLAAPFEVVTPFSWEARLRSR